MPENNFSRCRMKVSKLAELVNISMEHVHKHLYMRKLCAKWMHCLLRPVQQRCRKDVSTDCLALYKCNPTKCLQPFMRLRSTTLQRPNNSQKN